MKNMSIKKKVTLYYSLVLVLITVLVFGVFIVTIDLQTETVSKSTLMTAVQKSFDDVESDHNVLEIDDDFDSYYKGVTLLVYDDKGNLIKGAAPSGFAGSTPLTTGKYRKIASESDTWLVYDLYNTYENGQGIWIRGIYAMDNGAATLRSVILIMLVILPILLILAILAGRRITRKAFEPVSSITETAAGISSGSDLSQRLPCDGNKDELYYLSETLNDMMARLEKAFNAEKQFTSDVSHELRTPMAVVLSECEVMLRGEHDKSEYRESMETIQKQCRHTMSLIQQLLQLSRTMDKTAVMDQEEMDLSSLCLDVAADMETEAAERGIRIETDIQEGVDFHGDQTMLMRMLLNLIGNGIKYNHEPGYVRLSLHKDKSTVITVEDDGIGISASDQQNIFDRFYKADTSRQSDKDSFGLGLAMVRWIAEAHGGSVSVTSEPGRGSCFTVTL